MAAPIPMRLLVDTATVEEPDGTADYGGSWTAPRTIGHVRLDATTARSADTWRDDAPQQGALLFVDAHNSVPPQPPTVGSRVTVGRGGSEAYEGIATSCQACLDEGGIHHWEVTLS